MHMWRSVRPHMPFIAVVLVGTLAVGGLSLYAARDQDTSASDRYSTFDQSPFGFANYYQVLQAENLQPEQFSYSTSSLDDSYGTIILAEQNHQAIENDGYGQPTFAQQHFRAWLEAGGQAIYFRDHWQHFFQRFLVSPEEALLRQVNFAKRGGYHDGVVWPDAMPTTGPACRVRDPQALATAADVHDLAISVKRPIMSVPCAELLYADQSGPVALQWRIGAGREIFVFRADLFDNASLSIADRARFAVGLVTSGRPGKVAFDETLHGYDAERTWWSLFPGSVLVGAAVALFAWVLWLIGFMVRFGAAERAPIATATTVHSFLDATVAFLERAHAWDFADKASGASEPMSTLRASDRMRRAFLARVQAEQRKRKELHLS